MLSGEEKRRNEAAAKAARAKPKPKAAAAAAGAKPKLSAEEQLEQNEALYDAAWRSGEMGKLEAAIAAGAEVSWHNPDMVSELSELE